MGEPNSIGRTVQEAKRTFDLERDRWDLRTSLRILQNPMSAPEALTDFQKFLRQYHTAGINSKGTRPRAAELRVLQDSRRALQRVVAHNVERKLLPIVLTLLDPKSDIVDRLQEQGIDNVDQWEGARYRLFEGDSAKIAWTYEKLFTSIIPKVFDCYTETQQKMLLQCNYDLTTAVQRASVAVLEEESPKKNIPEQLKNMPYVGEHEENADVSFRDRTLLFFANEAAPDRSNNSLRPNIFLQLEANGVGFGEFYGSAFPTLAFVARKANCPPNEWFKMHLRNIAPFSAIAALKDSQSAEIFYLNPSPPPFAVTMSESDLWEIEVVREPLTAATKKVKEMDAQQLGVTSTMSERGRCPSNEALPPQTEEHRKGQVDLKALINEITDGHIPEHLKTVMLPSDVSAILAIVLTERLRQSGIIKLNPPAIESIKHIDPSESGTIFSQETAN
ncbi:MAG TPA: hypothetical protein VNW29_05525 [Candidatus Sulfotelmatobacter sp.]|jgi:hypothetical protein|nr:hypothetical protein [Candidatus Sulfotelmatobacter sp.]